jgi:hypothetical protein
MSESMESPRTPSRRKPVRWLSILVGLGVILVAGSVVADVVVAYAASNGVGPNTGSPFRFQQGGNYAAANAVGVITNTYPGGGSNGPAVTTTLNGISSVPVMQFDVTEFATAILTTRTGTLANVNVPAPVGVAPAGVVCAYAFVSTAVPTLGTTGVAGAPAGCSATLPTLGAVSAGCVGGSAVTAVVNLLTGAVSGTTLAGACTVPVGTAAATIVLYISYAITTNAAVVATSLNTFTVPVTLT